MQKTLVIKGMSCEHCVNRVKNTLNEIAGIRDVLVDLGSGAAKFEINDNVDMDEVVSKVEDAGYEVISID